MTGGPVVCVIRICFSHSWPNEMAYKFISGVEQIMDVEFQTDMSSTSHCNYIFLNDNVPDL
jgi:hypothetical protein